MSALAARLAARRGETYPKETRFGDPYMDGEHGNPVWEEVASNAPRRRVPKYPPASYWTPERLEELLVRLHLNQKELGDRVGRSERTVNGWFHGDHKVGDNAARELFDMASKLNPPWSFERNNTPMVAIGKKDD